jgi:hypothetical protein
MFEFGEAKQLVADMARMLDMKDPEWFLDPDQPYLDIIGPATFFPLSLLEKRAIKKAWHAETGRRAVDYLKNILKMFQYYDEALAHKQSPSAT